MPIQSADSVFLKEELPLVPEIGESSAGNLGTLERSNTYTQSLTRSIDAGFG